MTTTIFARRTTRVAATVVAVASMAATTLLSAGVAAAGQTAAVDRLAGADRFGTAAAVSGSSYPDHASAVVLARGGAYPDALVGVTLAAAKNGPLLLTEGASLPTPTKSEITRLLTPGSTVYILGGPASVPTSVQTQLATMGYQTVRYAGVDRYATSVAVADALGDPSTVFLADGLNFPDALSAGPAAAKSGGVVLLTSGKTLPPATQSYLAAHPGTTYAIGGPAAAAAPAAAALVGTDRYQTSVAVANQFFPSPSTVGIATGAAFPDALAGGAQLAHVGGPLLLTATNALPSGVASYLSTEKSSVTTAHLFGGPTSISAQVMTQVQQALGSAPTPPPAGGAVFSDANGTVDFSGVKVSCVGNVATIQGPIMKSGAGLVNYVDGELAHNIILVADNASQANEYYLSVVANGHLTLGVHWQIYPTQQGVQDFSAC